MELARDIGSRSEGRFYKRHRRPPVHVRWPYKCDLGWHLLQTFVKALDPLSQALDPLQKAPLLAEEEVELLLLLGRH